MTQCVRTPLLAAGTASCAVALLFATPAFASDPVILVGGPPLIADGTTTSTVQFWSPALAPEASVSVSGPVLGEATLDGGDFASVKVTPEAVTEPGELVLKVKVKSDQGKAAATLRVPVVPADRGEVGVAFDPPLFRVGVDDKVSVRVTLPRGPRAAGAQALEVHSSVGVIDTVTHEAGDVYVARWRPPADLPGSQVVVFAVVDQAAPSRVMGTAAYPVIVKKKLELPAAAGSTALLTVGERQFGPLPAGPDGKVRFDVERDPRVSTGRLRIVAGDGQITESEVELAFGEGPRFTFVPTPVGAVAASNKSLQITVVAVNPDGSPWTGKAPAVTASKGKVTGVVAATTPGRFVVTYTPENKPGDVVFTASLDGREASRTVKLVAPPELSKRSGSVAPVVLEGRDRDATFTIDGAAPGTVSVHHGEARGRISGGGPYTQAVRLDADAAQMVAHAGPGITPTGQPPSRIHLWTADATLKADASSTTPVLAVVLDDQGQPVPGVDVRLTVAVGTGTTTESLTTGPDGIAAGLYTAGNQVGPVTLLARGAGLKAMSPVFLEGAGYTGGELSVTGSPLVVAERDLWKQAVAVARAGRPLPAAQPAVAPMTGADLARIEAEKKAQAKAAKRAPKPVSDSKPAAGGSSGGGGGDPLAGLGPAPADGMGRSVTRVGVHIGAQPRTYEATASSGIFASGPTTFTTPGLAAPGLDVRGVRWLDAVGVEARLRYVSQPVAIPNQDDVELGGLDFVAGGRYRGAIAPGLTWQLAGGLHAQPMSAFTLANNALEETQSTLAGVRLGAAVVADRGPVFAQLELAETFVLSPATFQLGLTVGYEVADGLAVQAVYDYTSRATDIEDGDITYDVSESLNGIFVGVAKVFD